MSRVSGFADHDRGCSVRTPDIGNDLIAMTPLRQENRASRAAEKTGTHQGKDYLAQGRVDYVLVEGVEPRLV
jgi:hypothetical protein